MDLTTPKLLVQTLALIDDDDDDEFFMRRTLRKAGISTKVVRLYGGDDAIAYFSRQGRYSNEEMYPRAQLAFLDINMPGTSGFDVLAWLKGRPEVDRPFLAMLSSSELPGDKQRAFDLGADCYLAKPATSATLQDFAETHGFEWPTSG